MPFLRRYNNNELKRIFVEGKINDLPKVFQAFYVDAVLNFERKGYKKQEIEKSLRTAIFHVYENKMVNETTQKQELSNVILATCKEFLDQPSTFQYSENKQFRDFHAVASPNLRGNIWGKKYTIFATIVMGLGAISLFYMSSDQDVKLSVPTKIPLKVLPPNVLGVQLKTEMPVGASAIYNYAYFDENNPDRIYFKYQKLYRNASLKFVGDTLLLQNGDIIIPDSLFLFKDGIILKTGNRNAFFPKR